MDYLWTLSVCNSSRPDPSPVLYGPIPMATVLPEYDVESPDPPDEDFDALPDASALEDRTPEWFRTPRILSVFVFSLGLVYMLLNYVPLWHTDLWGHLSYGRLIAQSGEIPATEPLMPLASGVQFVDTAWLSQVVGFSAISSLGPTAIQAIYAAAVTICLALLAGSLFFRTQSAFWSLLAGGAFLFVNWQQLTIVRPQLAGLALFCLTFVLLRARRFPRAGWVVVPVMFALWANLHGSFAVGLAVIGLHLAGRAADVVRRTCRPRRLLKDPRCLRYLLMLQLASVAVLLNPYGIGIYGHVLTIASNQNLQDLVEWDALTLRMKQGQAAAVMALLLVTVYRMTPRRVSATEVLLILLFGVWSMWTSRMLNWWAPVAAYFFSLHGFATWRAFRSAPFTQAERPRTGLWTLVNGGMLWVFFALTPFGTVAVHGVESDFEKRVSQRTPVRAVAWLNDSDDIPSGQIFNAYEWGDYLLWAARPDLEVFVASHAHLVPSEVWRHYLTIAGAGDNWDQLLDRYGINTAIVDPKSQTNLVRRMRSHDDWSVGFEDERSVVFRRRDSIE